jgi:hypothetical protein
LFEGAGCHAKPAWSTLRRKQQTIWRNRRRNEIIATIAQALLLPQKKIVQVLGIPRDDIPKVQGPDRVTVLVGSTEHGRALLPLLPGWELCEALPTCRSEDPHHRMHPTAPRAGKVMTLVYAWRHRIRTPILVWAVGGPEALSMSGFPPLWNASAGQHILLIDLMDKDGDDFSIEAQRRLDYYETHHWQIIRTRRK